MYPVLLKLGPLTLYSYGLLVALGLLVGLAVVDLEAKRLGWNRDLMTKLVVFTFVAGLAGGRLTYALTRLGHGDALESLLDPHAGFVFYGGLVASWAFIHWQARKRGLAIWTVLDAFALAICAGEGIGRFGCLLGGCCYGKPTALAWGVTLAKEPGLGPLHPVQAYEGLALLAFFALLWARRKRKAYGGETVVFFVGGYALIRFVMEFFRGDAIRGFVVPGVLSTSQAIGLALLAFVIALHARLRRAGTGARGRK